MTEEDYKLLIGGLIEFFLEYTDYWDTFETEEAFMDNSIDWAKKLGKSLTEAPFPPNTPCTCPRDWADEKMKLVEKLIQQYKEI